MVSRAVAPDGVSGPCCYGPNVRAATALLACNGHMSIERAADLMAVLLDAPVSTGFTGGLVARIATHLHGFEQALKHRLRAAPVLHHDETPARVADDDRDRLLYVYTARAGTLVWFGAADNRGHAALDGFADPAGLPGHAGAGRLSGLRQVRQGRDRGPAVLRASAARLAGHRRAGHRSVPGTTVLDRARRPCAHRR
jgi:hypothetical protein